MEIWTCKGCGCEYAYLEATTIDGQMYCGICAENVDETPSVVPSIQRLCLIPFVLGVLVGLMMHWVWVAIL